MAFRVEVAVETATKVMVASVVKATVVFEWVRTFVRVVSIAAGGGGAAGGAAGGGGGRGGAGDDGGC